MDTKGFLFKYYGEVGIGQLFFLSFGIRHYVSLQVEQLSPFFTSSFTTFENERAAWGSNYPHRMKQWKWYFVSQVTFLLPTHEQCANSVDVIFVDFQYETNLLKSITQAFNQKRTKADLKGQILATVHNYAPKCIAGFLSVRICSSCICLNMLGKENFRKDQM